MPFAATAALGAVAGLTIYLGLPIGRLQRPRPRLVVFLSSAAVGILLFIFFDVIRNAGESVQTAMSQSRARGIGYALLLATGLAIGMMGLVVFEKVGFRRGRRPLPAGPGALASAAVLPAPAAAGRTRREPLAPPYRIAMVIPIGIGLHNFSQGLAPR